MKLTDRPENMSPKFTYSDVKFAESEAVFGRAVALFASGKVKDARELYNGYQATVIGTEPYSVRISSKRIDYADCDCYLGQHDALCKHMLALALAVLHMHGQVDAKGQPTATTQLAPEDVPQHIAAAMKKIRPYDGPSRIWFEYQRNLDIAAGMIAEAVPLLEPTQANAAYLWKLVVKLSNKLAVGGIDDSNGTIGGAIMSIVEQLVVMAKQDEKICSWAQTHCTQDTGFGFEQDLQDALAAIKPSATT